MHKSRKRYKAYRRAAGLGPLPDANRDAPPRHYEKRLRSDDDDNARQALAEEPRVLTTIGVNGDTLTSRSSPYFDEMSQRSSSAPLQHKFNIQTYFADQPLIKNLQGGSDWLNARKGITITASNYAACMGLLPFKNSKSTYHQLLSAKETTFDSNSWQYVTWGKEMEPVARQFLRDEFFLEIREVGTFINSDDPRLGATPDGLIVNGVRDKRLTLLEIKCPAREHNFAKTGIPLYYLLQVYGEMKACGVDNCIFMSWLPKKFSLWYITFDNRIWDSYMYPKLRMTIEALEHKMPWDPKMTIWKDELTALKSFMHDNVYKLCDFDSTNGQPLRWYKTDVLVDTEKIHISGEDVCKAQNLSLMIGRDMESMLRDLDKKYALLRNHHLVHEHPTVPSIDGLGNRVSLPNGQSESIGGPISTPTTLYSHPQGIPGEVKQVHPSSSTSSAAVVSSYEHKAATKRARDRSRRKRAFFNTVCNNGTTTHP
jgi:putative phage-type endonuclease